MASYSMSLREVIQMVAGNDTLSTREQIEQGRRKLFDFDYPVFDLDYKKVFETHFIRKFYMREIGFETEGLFKFQLETWLLINMPYFNKMFESELLKFDPLKNVELNVSQNKTKDKKQDQSSTMDGTNQTSTTQHGGGTLKENDFNRQIESDTPESRLSITANDGIGVIEYASNIKENTDSTLKTSTNDTNSSGNGTTNVTSSSNGNINEIEDYIETRAGKVGDKSYSKMLQEYRESFLRIENKIFEEMQELFMLVY